MEWGSGYVRKYRVRPPRARLQVPGPAARPKGDPRRPHQHNPSGNNSPGAYRRRRQFRANASHERESAYLHAAIAMPRLW